MSLFTTVPDLPWSRDLLLQDLFARNFYDLFLTPCKTPTLGDWDNCVPYTDNEAWTEGMGYSPKTPWHAWEYELTTEGVTSKQVGGCKLASLWLRSWGVVVVVLCDSSASPEPPLRCYRL